VAEGVGEGQATGASTGTADAFISYASQDAAIAAALVAALEQHGVACWIAPRDVEAGALYADAIVRAIGGARVFVLVLSASAIASSHVGKEVERASSKKRPILAFRTDTAPLTPAFEYFLSESQWIEAQAENSEAAYAKLIGAIRKPALAAPGSSPAVTPSAATAPAAPPIVGGRNRILLATGLAVVLVTIVALLADKYWLAKRDTAEQRTTPATNIVSDKSIAVLPFIDMSEQKDQEYFSDGLSEELIDLLVKVPDLRVPARTSSFYFKGKSEDIPTIAKRLLVANVLEGSVRKSGDHLRVTVQLIRADNGYNLWSETYDRQVEDIFKLQDEIATAVVGALKLKLLAPTTGSNRQTANPEAYNQYLIGRHLLLSENWVVDRSAAAAFGAAAKLDPNYAIAWAGLAEADFDAAEDVPSVAELVAQRQQAQREADKAIALQPDLADGYAVRGYIRSWGLWQFQAAGEDFRRALALEPENYDVLVMYARAVLLPTGRLDEAVSIIEKALKTDPLNSSYWRRLGYDQTFRGNYPAAVDALQRSLEINPQQSNTAGLLAYAFILAGEPARALSISQRATAEVFRQQGAALAEHDLGHAQEAQRQLSELISKGSVTAAYQIAEVYAWWGDKDQAFRWLDSAYAQHDAGFTFVKGDPLLRGLRSDPRYKALLRKMNLPQ
jgi:TolB-like protein/Tfp pilus assembly protein PilF